MSHTRKANKARRDRRKRRQAQLEAIAKIAAFNLALQGAEKINLELVDRRIRKYLVTKDDEATIKRIGVRECPRLYLEPILITTKQCQDTVMRSFQPRVNECADDDDRALVLY